MRSLLCPASIPTRDARDLCLATLRRILGRRAAALRTAPVAVHADLAVLALWFLLMEEALLLPNPDRRRVLLSSIGAEIEGAIGSVPLSPFARALFTTLQAHHIPPMLFQAPLAAARELESLHGFPSHAEHIAHLRRAIVPHARAMLLVLGLQGERNEVLAEALALGIGLTRRLECLQLWWGRGHLVLPMDDLRLHGATVAQIDKGQCNDAIRQTTALQAERARTLLAKGWPLCQEAGPLLGRGLAFTLRWHSAALSALEARGFNPLGSRPPAGLLRGGACLLLSSITRQPPFPSGAR